MKLLRLVAIIIWFPFTLCLGADSPKTVVVTCATGELGSAAAKLLGQTHNLILTGRDREKLCKLKEELTAAFPHRYEICTLDYCNKDSLLTFKDYLKKINLPLSGIVLIYPRPQTYGKDLLLEESTWLEVIQKTFTGPLEALKCALPHMTNPSKIVVISGTTSVQYIPDAGAACIIRRMWTTYVKGLSHQLGPQSISVNALSPGVVLTAFHHERIEKKAHSLGISHEEQIAHEVEPIPLKRHAKPEEVAKSIKFLLTHESDFISGINMVIDGGLSTSY
ncbi:MAG: SDR family oxidoreductase [Parachlamydiales bacterium]|jgi:NAD(P)-dependent dehydrogenase (short-subunit alcohol dehydrogenase family)